MFVSLLLKYKTFSLKSFALFRSALWHATLWVAIRVARWFVFKPKIPIWVNFGGPWNGKCRYILWSFGIFYDQLVDYLAIWQCCGNLVYFPLFWYIVKRKNLATLATNVCTA
jgi:thiol-disulfide isomerase/thioredoxin